MDVKIAIASSDGLTVNEHFGRADNFHIYRLRDAGYQYVEMRKIIPVCSGHSHDDDALAKLAQSLSDCRGVVASLIGPGAVDALLIKRIMAFALLGSIDQAMQTLANARRLAYLK